MDTSLLILQFILAIVLTISVLLQKSSSIGLGAYSGSNDSVFGAKGPANFLTRFTFIIGFIFVANTVTLGYMFNKNYNKSIADDIEIAVPNVEDKSIAPSAPIVPTSPKETSTEVPTAPAIPSVPTTETTK